MVRKIMLLAMGLLIILTGCYYVPVKETPKAEWVPITIRATGNGAPPPSAVNQAQARLMTERAAKLDGYIEICLNRHMAYKLQAPQL